MSSARDAELKKKEDEKVKLEAVHAKQANMFGSFFRAKSKPVAPSNAKASTSSSPISKLDPEDGRLYLIARTRYITGAERFRSSIQAACRPTWDSMGAHHPC